MRILLVITGLGMGGAEKVVSSLADALDERGHEVLLVYMTGSATVLPQRAAVRLATLRMSSLFALPAGYKRLRELIRDFKPDVVHGHMFHAIILTRCARLLSDGIPRLISTAHSTEVGGRLRAWAYRLSNKLSDVFTNVSEAAVKTFEQAGAAMPGQLLATHNGVSVQKFRPRPEMREDVRKALGFSTDQKMLLAVGRLIDAKDYPNLLRAFSIARRLGEARLLIVGEGGQRGQIEDLANELGVADRIAFMGIRDDVHELMAAADVFVLSSAWEGFGMVVAEAMACGCVVVATDSGGVREVVGDAGFLVPTRNPCALAEGIERAATLPYKEAAAIGSSARKRVIDHYSLDAMVDKWVGIYTG